MRRYCFYIDGLNVYHAIKAAAPQYLWLDYGALARNVVGAKDTIRQVLYFTTIARFKRRTIKPHEQYIKALRWRRNRARSLYETPSPLPFLPSAFLAPRRKTY